MFCRCRKFQFNQTREMQMKKLIFVVAAAGIMLTACASHHPYGPTADPLNPVVSVVDGKQIVVNQDPLVYAREVQNVRISWRLPADSKYTFPKDGIVVNEAREEIVDCRPAEDGRSFSCLNRHTRPGKYKYNIKVQGTPVVPVLDPVIVND